MVFFHGRIGTPRRQTSEPFAAAAEQRLPELEIRALGGGSEQTCTEWGTLLSPRWRLMNQNAGHTLNSTRQSAVIVTPDPADVAMITAVLPATEFELNVVQTFADAKPLVATSPIAVLITDLRLGEYNGLHLVLRAKTMWPRMAAVLLSDLTDRVLQAEAERLGATFVTKPVSSQELAAAIFRTIYRAPGDATPIRAPFERRAATGRAASSVVGHVPDRRVDRRAAAPPCGSA